MLNDSPVGCQTRAVTEPQRDGGICEANDGEVFKNVTFKPLSRARKERAPGIPRGMMRGKSPSRQMPAGIPGRSSDMPPACHSLLRPRFAAPFIRGAFGLE